ADGVFPSNEGRGHVLRRILRRAVRHAWLLGRREPTLVEVVDAAIDQMGGAYPELSDRRDHILRSTRAEEERFLSTIDAGMHRFEEIAPSGGSGAIAGAEVFRLHDTFGFPPDLTELMAAERGYSIDAEGYERELEQQRRRSRADRAAAGIGGEGDPLAAGWKSVAPDSAEQAFVAYTATEVGTEILAFRPMEEGSDGRLALHLRENPFYAESGGQLSDAGRVDGEGWWMSVDEVRRVAGRIAVVGPVEGEFRPGAVRASVEAPRRRDTERNHTATHLLHAALRRVLGDHVFQQGSRVGPDRLRFDFSHHGQLTLDELAEVERQVNDAIWANTDVCSLDLGYSEALARGAMALFSEKYGDMVRVVEIPGVSMELCGGTHVRTTGQIGLIRILSESGVAAGVRRLEAVTGGEAYAHLRRDAETVREAARLLRTGEENLLSRIQTLQEELREAHRTLERARSLGSADVVGQLLATAYSVDGARVVAGPVGVADAGELRALGDRLREQIGSGVAVLAATFGGRATLLAVVTDDMIRRGARADTIIREVAALAGGSGGGKAHMAQAGVPEGERVPAALEGVPDIVRELLADSAA
ncbi:MAG: alanine--tRNA ligase, partial [Gemmatimonadota bacterium]|nr:alanine--tRNA ligase [Gemmatimonadota bacterium]